MWFRSTVAVAAIVAVASGPLATSFIQPAAAQEAAEPALGSESLVGRDQAEVAALPDDELYGEQELDTLVAPVALYPDALLAQVLVAATYPLQIVKADRLLDETEGLSDDAVAERIAAEDWDPSVMVLLSGFPTVVRRMADDLDWTEQLGTAMVGQDGDVLAAVQRMRTQALDTGWLESNDAQVVERSDDAVSIRPKDPDVVYVPSYDSSLAYTSPPTAAPYVAPSTNPLANPVVAGAMAFGAALLVQKLFEDDDDGGGQDRGWGGYWRGSEPFDWRDRQFYPRPDRGWRPDGDGGYAWSRERDDHWDRGRRGWQYDARAQAERERARREAIAWTNRPNSAEGMSRIGQLRAVAAQPPEDIRRPQPAVQRPVPTPPAARDADATRKAAAQKQAAQKQAAQKEAAQKQAAQKQAAQKQAAQKEAAQKQAAQKQAAQKQAAQKQAAQKQAAQKEAAQKQAAQKQAAQKEAAQKQAAQKEAAQKQAAQKEAAQKQAAQKQATQKQAAQKQAAQKQAAQKQAAQKQAAQKQAAQKQAAQKQAAQKQAAQKQATQKQAAQKQAAQKQAAQKQAAQKQAKPARKPACKPGTKCPKPQG